MFPRKLIPLCLVAALALFAGTNQNVSSGRAQDSLLAPDAPLGTSFTYQGVLTNSNDNPINGSCDFRFSLYNAESSGVQVGTTLDRPYVALSKGSFTVVLDFGNTAFTGEACWLEVTVRCPAGSGPYTTLSPRQALTPSPYAAFAQSVGPHSHWGDTWNGNGVGLTINSVDDVGLDASGVNVGILSHSENGNGLVSWTNATSGFTTAVTGWVGSPDGIGVRGIADATNGYTQGVQGHVQSTHGAGVTGEAVATTGDTIGVLGVVASPEGRGVWGHATSTYGFSNGVTGEVASPDGRGVWGIATAATGNTIGVTGEVNSPNGTGIRGLANATIGPANGVYGESYSLEGFGISGRAPYIGVSGEATATSGHTYGVLGWSNSTEGRGVEGYVTTTSGTTYGVIGYTTSPDGRGVRGLANSTNGGSIGVMGEVMSPDGWGVWGLSNSTTGGIGVWGQTGGPDGIGVYGQASSVASNWAVFGYGNIGATGTISELQSGKKYGWMHLYAMVSPEVLFEDVGTAQLVEGISVVTIDSKFAETVNLNVPYQVFLTPRGDCGLFLAETTPTNFTVRALGGAKCSLAFDYRMIAKRLGYEDVRMAPAADPNQELNNNNPPEADLP
jgi:hypothetical protein